MGDSTHIQSTSHFDWDQVWIAMGHHNTHIHWLLNGPIFILLSFVLCMPVLLSGVGE